MLLQTCLNLNISTNENLQSNKGYQNNLSIVCAIQIKSGKNFYQKMYWTLIECLSSETKQNPFTDFAFRSRFLQVYFQNQSFYGCDMLFCFPIPSKQWCNLWKYQLQIQTCYLMSDSRVINSWSPLTSLTDINQQETKQGKTVCFTLTWCNNVLSSLGEKQKENYVDYSRTENVVNYCKIHTLIVKSWRHHVEQCQVLSNTLKAPFTENIPPPNERILMRVAVP